MVKEKGKVSSPLSSRSFPSNSPKTDPGIFLTPPPVPSRAGEVGLEIGFVGRRGGQRSAGVGWGEWVPGS